LEIVLEGELGDGGEFDNDDFAEVLADIENELILRYFVISMGAVWVGPSESVLTSSFWSTPFGGSRISFECVR
jgi:hypothetical protein